VASEPESDSEENGEFEARFASVGIKNGKDSFFPGEEDIKAAKAKRERMRKAGAAAPDYISLDGGSNHGAADGLSDEEPEYRGRIAMFGGEKGDGEKKGVFEVVDERFNDEVVDEEDEEDRLWEEEQFKKGLGKRRDEGSARVGGGGGEVPVVQVAQQPNFAGPSVANVYGAAPNVVAAASANTSIGGAIPATPVLDVISISQQAEIAKKAMLDNVRRLKV